MGFPYANTLCVVGKATCQVETSPAEWEMLSNMLLMREYFLKKIKLNKIQVSQRIARKGQPNEQWVKHLTDIFQEIYGKPTSTGENGPMRWLSG